jgi:MFS family permease
LNPILLILAVGVAAFTATTASRVLLSLYALDLGASQAQVGALFAMHFVFPLLLCLPIGRWADRYGSRGLLTMGMAVGTLAMVIPWFMPSVPALFVAAALNGFAFAFSSVLVLNLVGLMSRPHERARNFANMSLTGSSANVLGPLIAGFAIDHAGYGIASLCSAALSLLAVLLLMVWGGALPGAAGAKAARARSSLRELFSDRTTVGIIAVSCVVQTGADLFSLYLPIHGHGLKLSASVIGAIIAAFFVAVCIPRIVMPQLIKALGERRLLAWSMYLAALGFALMPWFAHPVMLGAMAFILGLGMGCCQPITMMMLFNRAPEGRSGETVALRQTANNVARVAVPPIAGVIAMFVGLMGVFMLSALMMAAGGRGIGAGKAR